MKTEILRLLRDQDSYVSGQQLCEQFGVSRTAVWKVINQLKEEGYQVEAIRNKGYRIVNQPDLMTQEEIQSRIADSTKWAGQSLHVYPVTDSTNIQEKQLGETGALHGTLVVADKQNAGRGRRGRSWESPQGCSIYMSILLRPDFMPDKAPMLTLVMAYSVEKALKNCTGLNVQIKWLNDLIINGKKVVGILTEMSTEIDYINHVVIGVGINVNMESFPMEIEEKATSLRIEAGCMIQRSQIIAEIMRQFEQDYEKFLETEDLSWLKDDYNTCLVNRGRDVVIHGAEGSYGAQALGINDTGELLVRREDGSEEAVYAGEVSVRGVYGYV